MDCYANKLPDILFISLLLMGNIIFAFAIEIEEGKCDHYILLHSNMTLNGVSSGMKEKPIATVLSHAFEPNIVMNSWCVHIRLCVPPGSKAHMDLMTATRTHKSLTWKIIPCHDQLFSVKEPKDKLVTGCQPVKVGYFVLDPYVISKNLSLDGADIRIWNILASKLNLCGTFIKGSDPFGAFLMIASRTVDLVVGQIGYTANFFGSSDYANAMGYKVLHLIHGHPQQVKAIWTIFYPFDDKTWITVILFTLFVSLVMVRINTHKYTKESPSFRITAIAVLGVISESFPTKWLDDKITSQVKLILFIWLPMSFLLGCVYKSSLLRFLLAGEFDDPPDTFEKVLERDLIIVLPSGAVSDQLFGDSPFEIIRTAYNYGKTKGGYYPWDEEIPLESKIAVIEGRAVDIKDADSLVGNRHHARISKREHPVGYLLTGVMFMRNSPLRAKMQPTLERLMDSGIYVQLKDMFLWRKAKPERDYERIKHNDELVVLTWDHVGWTFLLVMSSGLAMSCIIFIVEVLIHFPKLPKLKLKNDDSYSRRYGSSELKQIIEESDAIVEFPPANETIL